ncbi:hypothetical protein LIA77_04951 [Sarocladium implicatum]|nr:hypothetical protein LIA77_04951 [Sarocladium implicatum]
MASMRSCFSSSLLNEKHKTKVHAGQLALVVGVIGLVIASIATKPAKIPISRSDTIGIVMGAKSLVVLTYELLTTHVNGLTKWASTKAYLILNCLEVPFWFVVVILTFMGVSRQCQGVSCGLSIVVAFVAMVLVMLACWVTVVIWRERKYSRKAQAAPYAEYGY